MIVHSAAPGTARKSTLAVEQAVVALRSGNRSEAERLLVERVAAEPRDAAALAKLGELRRDQGRTAEALLLLRRAVAAQAVPETHVALARLLQQQGHLQQALDTLALLASADRARFDVRTLEAELLGLLGRQDEELALYALLVVERPDHPGLWTSYGNALKTAGRSGEAVAALRRAIELRPAHGEAWWTLANLKTFRFDDRDVAAMRKALRGRLAQGDALHFHFALGKALEDRGEARASFDQYAAGNRIRAAQLAPPQMRITGRVDRAIACFNRDLFERHADAGDPARDPIFVVGLQRSGSTLVEQILASHPEIEGTAELLAMEQLWAELAASAPDGDGFAALANLDAGTFSRLGAAYLERTRPFRESGRPLFVDKLPANWLNVGLIRLALPNARIIDARRHPLACGFSNFRQHYATGVSFSYSLESIGHFYRDYLRLMDHFDRVQPGAVHHLLNERLIDDPEGQVRRLLDFVGVEFDPACLEFHRNVRPVRSASSEQVRRPINREGMDYWRRYERWLGPLKESLGDALERWDQV